MPLTNARVALHMEHVLLPSPAHRDADGGGTARPGCQSARVPASRLPGPARGDPAPAGMLPGWREREDTPLDHSRAFRPRPVLLLAQPRPTMPRPVSAGWPARRACTETG